MKYPKECPVFLSTNPFYPNKIVEGVDWKHDGYTTNSDIFFRFIDGTVCLGGDSDIDGLQPQWLEPLTPAAEAMKAIVLAEDNARR